MLPTTSPCDDNAGTGFNYSRWISDEFDAQMAIAGSSPDLEVRKAAYQKGSELIAEGRPHIYLYDRADIDLLREHFKGYDSQRLDLYRLLERRRVVYREVAPQAD